MAQYHLNILLLLLFLGKLFGLPGVPQHSFEKRATQSKIFADDETNCSANVPAKKVFVKLHVGPFTFKKRKAKGGRITFTCDGCQRYNHYLAVQARHEPTDSDPEHDEYTLDVDTLPAHSDHACVSSGVEDLGKQLMRYNRSCIPDNFSLQVKTFLF